MLSRPPRRRRAPGRVNGTLSLSPASPTRRSLRPPGAPSRPSFGLRSAPCAGAGLGLLTGHLPPLGSASESRARPVARWPLP
eukprot:3754876-Alexandrium_andersonii.AAC.1